SFTRIIPENVLGVRGALWAPASAVAVLLAMPLLVTIASPRKWRRWANPPAAVAAPGYTPPAVAGDESGYPGTPYPGAPSYSPSYSPSPAYPGSPAYSAAPAYQSSGYQAPTSGAPAPGYAAPTSGPPAQSSDATTPLPA